MKQHEQKNIEVKVSEAQIEERKDENLARPSYRSPEMFLVGKAKHLVSANPTGFIFDMQGLWRLPNG